jgi:hypothetical protein
VATTGNCPHCGAWRGPGPTCPACGRAYDAPVMPVPPLALPPEPAVGTAAKRRWAWVLGCVAFLVVLAILAGLTRGGSAAPGMTAPISSPSSSGQGAAGAITISGKGPSHSEIFTLEPGEYRVTWTITPSRFSGCFQDAKLAGEYETFYEVLLVESADAGSPMSGETRIGVNGGRYIVRVETVEGCSWTYTFTRK